MSFFVYHIFNTFDGKCYVGKAKSFKDRVNAHFKYARIGVKGVLYNAIRKYEHQNFVVSKLGEFLLESEALKAERYWISFFDATSRSFGYNITPGGDGPSGYKILNPKPKTIEHRQNISKGKMGWKGLCGKDNPNSGGLQPHVIEIIRERAKKRIGSKNSNAKLTEELVREIKVRLKNGASILDIRVDFEISRSQVLRIKCNKAWKHVIITT